MISTKTILKVAGAGRRQPALCRCQAPHPVSSKTSSSNMQPTLLDPLSEQPDREDLRQGTLGIFNGTRGIRKCLPAAGSRNIDARVRAFVGTPTLRRRREQVSSSARQLMLSGRIRSTYHGGVLQLPGAAGATFRLFFSAEEEPEPRA